MVRLITFVVFISLCIFVNQLLIAKDVESKDAQSVITNETIIELIKAGLSEVAIIKVIESNSTQFNVSPNDLVELKKNGVSNKLIEIMIDRNNTNPLQIQKTDSSINQTAYPQYYGFYLLKDKKFIEVNSSYEGEPEELNGEVKFILFDKNVKTLMNNIHLVTMKYINNKISYSGGDFRKPEKKVSRIGKWDAVFCSGERSRVISLGIQPVANNQEIVYLSPKSTLSKGAYALVIGSLGDDFLEYAQRRIVYKFFVDKEYIFSSLDTENNFCVNLVLGNQTGGWANWLQMNQGWTSVSCEQNKSSKETNFVKTEQTSQKINKDEEFPSEYKQGTFYAKNGQYEKAIAEWLKALEKGDKNIKIYYNLGIAYTKVGKLDDAIAIWQSALEKTKETSSYFYLIGLAYKEKGAVKNAELYLNKSIEVDPEFYDVYKVLEEFYRSQELYEEADRYAKIYESQVGSDITNKEISDMSKIEIAAITFEELLSGEKDANLFDSHYSVFNYKYEDVWDAVNYVLNKKKEKIITSDEESGIIITDTCRWSMNRKYYKYYILVERINDTTTKLNLKLIAHNSNWDKNLKRSILKPMNKTFVNDKFVRKFIYEVREKLGDGK
ncbi:MAG: tetratricopeptide repeat protein [Planctomycetes bacterium]|nr:tetratricopeptide repeat protein [Planctomycetota bacterium]